MHRPSKPGERERPISMTSILDQLELDQQNHAMWNWGRPDASPWVHHVSDKTRVPNTERFHWCDLVEEICQGDGRRRASAALAVGALYWVMRRPEQCVTRPAQGVWRHIMARGILQFRVAYAKGGRRMNFDAWPQAAAEDDEWATDLHRWYTAKWNGWEQTELTHRPMAKRGERLVVRAIRWAVQYGLLFEDEAGVLYPTAAVMAWSGSWDANRAVCEETGERVDPRPRIGRVSRRSRIHVARDLAQKWRGSHRSCDSGGSQTPPSGGDLGGGYHNFSDDLAATPHSESDFSTLEAPSPLEKIPILDHTDQQPTEVIPDQEEIHGQEQLKRKGDPVRGDRAIPNLCGTHALGSSRRVGAPSAHSKPTTGFRGTPTSDAPRAPRQREGHAGLPPASVEGRPRMRNPNPPRGAGAQRAQPPWEEPRTPGPVPRRVGAGEPPAPCVVLLGSAPHTHRARAPNPVDSDPHQLAPSHGARTGRPSGLRASGIPAPAHPDPGGSRAGATRQRVPPSSQCPATRRIFVGGVGGEDPPRGRRHPADAPGHRASSDHDPATRRPCRSWPLGLGLGLTSAREATIAGPA